MRCTLIATLAMACGSFLPAQSEREVLEALNVYFAKDADSKPARARLEAWGDGVLPHLKSIAQTWNGIRLGLPLVCALSDLRSKEATEFWVQILRGKSKVEPMTGRTGLIGYMERADARNHLADHAQFRKVIEKLRTSESFLDRGYFLRVVRKMGWEDAAPMVRKMTKDIHLGVRKDAAATLEALTGEQVAIAGAPLVFRGRRLIENLFDPAEPLQKKEGWASQIVSFTRWFDGEPCAMFGSAKKFVDLAGKESRAVQLDRFGHRFLSLTDADGKRSFAVLVADTQHGGPEYAIGWSKDGKALWEYKPPSLGIKDAARLWDDQGEYGVVLGVGGKTGLVALDGEGKKVWQLRNEFVVYATSTHPKLPGELLLVSGSGTFVRHSRETKRVRQRKLARTPAFAYAEHGVLFPGEDGKRAAIVAGSSSQSEPVVARFDDGGRLVWRAFLPESAGGLVMLAPKKHGQLFVVTTKAGHLLAFDAKGVLRWEGKLPNPMNKKELATYALEAGETAPGSWVVAVKLLSGWYVFSVRDGK